MLKDKIVEDLNVPELLVEKALKEAYAKVKLLRLVKKDKTFRNILQPSRNLKVIQYWLINNIFVKFKIHSSAIAYRKGYSVKNNANLHSKNKYFLKLDLKDFFPSITFNDFLPIVSAWHSVNVIDWPLDSTAKELIKRSCFDKQGRLPIGYPTSPVISNAVMYDFDSSISSVLCLDKEKYGEVVYTRYADDIIFSTNKKGASNEIYLFVEDFIKDLKSPKLEINPVKTRFSSSSGGSAFLTGLRICYDGHVTIHKKYKDHARLLLSLLKRGKLKPEEYVSLKGHISYIKHVDPCFYNKLQRKYFEDIKKFLG